MMAAAQERVVHHETRARRWRCFVRLTPDSDEVYYGAWSRQKRAHSQWFPETFETAPAELIANARAAARKLKEVSGEGA